MLKIPNNKRLKNLQKLQMLKWLESWNNSNDNMIKKPKNAKMVISLKECYIFTTSRDPSHSTRVRIQWKRTTDQE